MVTKDPLSNPFSTRECIGHKTKGFLMQQQPNSAVAVAGVVIVVAVVAVVAAAVAAVRPMVL